jgi:hypothetical protein
MDRPMMMDQSDLATAKPMPGRTAGPDAAADLYIDLLKRCLTDSIFIDDPLAQYRPYHLKPQTARAKRVVIEALRRFLQRYQISLVEPFSDAFGTNYSRLSAEDLAAVREGGTRWPVRAHSMIGLKRLNNLQHCVRHVLQNGIPGDLIETGVWRGGACILMRGMLKAYGVTDRYVWAADSFEGLPPPSPGQYAADAGDQHHTYSDWLACSIEEVRRNFERYGLLDEQVRFLKGWFKDTLPTAPIERLAVIRLDGDMYESTMQALDALYGKLSPGGFVIVDDYFLKPCAQAIHDFRAGHGIEDEIHDIDGMGAFWQRAR